MLIGRTSFQDSFEVWRRCRKNDFVALNETLLVASQGHVVEVLLVPHLLQVGQHVRRELVPLEDEAVLRTTRRTPHSQN